MIRSCGNDWNQPTEHPRPTNPPPPPPPASVGPLPGDPAEHDAQAQEAIEAAARKWGTIHATEEWIRADDAREPWW